MGPVCASNESNLKMWKRVFSWRASFIVFCSSWTLPSGLLKGCESVTHFLVLQTWRSGVDGIHPSLHQLDAGQSSVRTWLWVDSCLWSPWTTQNQGQAGWPLCNGHFVCSKYSRHTGHNFSLNPFFWGVMYIVSTAAFSILILAVFKWKYLC